MMAEKTQTRTKPRRIVRDCVWSLVVLLVAALPGTQLVGVAGRHMIPYTHPDVIADQARSAASR
jgi:hypothetical protein